MVSDAAEHDSQVLDDILDLWVVGGQRCSAEIEASLKEKGLRSRIHAVERARETRQQDPFVGSGPRRSLDHGRDASG